MSSAARALVIVIAAAACGAPAASPVATAASVPTTAPVATVARTAAPAAAAPSAAAPTPKATFPAGLYVVKPALDHPGGTIELLESTATLAKPLAFTGVGYDISADLFIYTEFDGLVLVRPDGTSQKLKVNGLYALGRPSLSPDSKLVFLQATDTAFAQAPNVQRPQDDTVWIVDLAAAGYKPDARFPGAGSGGTFPLSGTFSLDDKTIVFDGAVEKDGQFGVLLCKINVDGSGFAVMRGPTQVTPMFSNNHNFSQLLPHWLAGR